MATRSAAKARRDVAGAARGSLVTLHFTDIVERVRRIPYEWPFPLSVPPQGGIVRNQTVKRKEPVPTVEQLGEAPF